MKSVLERKEQRVLEGEKGKKGGVERGSREEESEKSGGEGEREREREREGRVDSWGSFCIRRL